MNFFDSQLCLKCKGRGWCGKSCKTYSKIKNFVPKISTHFSGNSPPEIFVGKYDYPNVNAGILSPNDSEGAVFGEPIVPLKNTEEFSTPEIWYEKNFSIEQILANRGKLIYGRFKTNIKNTPSKNKFLGVMQEVSMAYKSVSTEFFLKKPPKQSLEISRYSPVIGNPATLEYARLQENPKVKPKVETLVSDDDVKSTVAINEMYKAGIPVSDVIKILSAGLLGLKTQRKLVPTRWAITAVDDGLSKDLLKKIKYYPEIGEIMLFHGDYVGNHYEILLLPDNFSFEVIEAEMSGGVWNQTGEVSLTQDYELFNGRKSYATEVTGAYYVNRLALAEYLEKIKKQASALFIREARPEYSAPLGVGILRECCRGAFARGFERFNSIDEAFKRIQERLKLESSLFRNKSILLKEYGKQKKLGDF